MRVPRKMAPFSCWPQRIAFAFFPLWMVDVFDVFPGRRCTRLVGQRLSKESEGEKKSDKRLEFESQGIQHAALSPDAKLALLVCSGVVYVLSDAGPPVRLSGSAGYIG